MTHWFDYRNQLWWRKHVKEHTAHMAISRRAFIKRSLGAGTVLYLYANGGYKIVTAAVDPTETYRLRIIHTNDHHARIEPEQVTIQSGSPSLARNFGGVSRRKTVFEQIRQEAAAAANLLDKNILFLDAGDVFQGTLYFNLYKGKADLEAYNALGYDASAVGNHEFDNGDQNFADYVTGALLDTPTPPNFSILAANIVAGSDPLKSLISSVIASETAPGGTIIPGIVKTVGTEKVGIFGLTTIETKTGSSPKVDTIFLDPMAVQTGDSVIFAQKQVDALKAAGATKIIALTHLGYEVDKVLAAQTRGIDVIVGGHSHTPLVPKGTNLGPVGVSAAGEYPTMQPNLDGKMVPIVTDWEWGKWMGDVTLSFNAGGELLSATGSPKPLWADGALALTSPNPTARDLIANEGTEIPTTQVMEDIIAKYQPGVLTLRKTVIGTSSVLIQGGSGVLRTRETNGGNLVSDAVRERVLSLPIGQVAGLPVVTIMNSGGIRDNIVVGNITVEAVLKVLPFPNNIAIVDLTGAQIVAALENGVSTVESTGGRFPQVSGLKFVWRRYGVAAIQATAAQGSTPAKPGVKGSRIERVQVLEGTTYVPLDLTKTYRIATNNFQLTGGDGYNVFTAKGDKADLSVGGGTNQLDTGILLSDAVQDYIKAKGSLAPAIEGRITAMSKYVLPMVFRTLAAVTR